MTTKEIIAAYKGLREFRETSSIALPSKIVFSVVRNLRRLEPIVEDYDICYRELLEKNGEPVVGELNQFRIPEDKVAYMQEQMQSLLNVDHPDISLCRISIDDIDGFNLSITELDALYPMIEEGDY